MEDKYILRHIFLREITKKLIDLSRKNSYNEQLDPEFNNEISKIRSTIKNETPSERIMKKKVMMLPKVPLHVKNNDYKNKELSPEEKSEQISTSGMERSIMSAPIEKPNQKLNISKEGFDLGKIRNILSDPRIQTLECQGPDKFILVKKDGNIMSTKVSLNKSEVDDIINAFSRESKVPLIGGTFKAIVGNLIMTAVTSEFVGNRFIIQKRNPFQQINLTSPSTNQQPIK